MVTKQKHLASMQLEHFEVVNSELLEKPDGKSQDIVVDIDFELLRAEDEADERLGLEIRLDINKRRRDTKLKGSFEVVASFRFGEALDQKQRIHLLLFNGLATAYSLLRGVVFQKASSLPPALRLLPILNLVELVNEKKKKIKSKSPEQRHETG